MGRARRSSVAAVARFGPADQDRNPRKFEQLIGNSPALESVLEQVEQVAPTDSTVLIQGETGTGKELIARAIHNLSARCGRPFIKLNCAAIPFDWLESERLGSTRTQQVNIRLVAATNRNLADMVKRNEFRGDLYYRLNVFPIPLQPLRARREDIPALVEHFVEIYARRMDKQIEHIPPETMSALASYQWPGNIRELQNFIERSVILTSGNVLHPPLASLK